jgi:RNA polymerase sigma-70 factor (ECF subfamily)
MQELTDAELIKIYLKGEQAALEELVRRYFRQVFLFTKTFVKQDQEAEDITQETFIKAWKNLKSFDPEKKFKTWIFQIAKNTCIDYLRKNKNMLAADSLQEEQMSISLEHMTDTNPLPEQLFDSLGFEKKLEEVLNTLPENYKQTVSLHLQQDLTFQEISEILNEPLNTVKSRYRRALLSLRQSLPKDNG